LLSHDQCIEYALPRTPIKELDRRAARFEARFGEGATEPDALEALHPGEIRRILVREIERYYDGDLKERIEETASELEARSPRSIAAPTNNTKMSLPSCAGIMPTWSTASRPNPRRSPNALIRYRKPQSNF
jgi:hypothetical protein